MRVERIARVPHSCCVLKKVASTIVHEPRPLPAGQAARIGRIGRCRFGTWRRRIGLVVDPASSDLAACSASMKIAASSVFRRTAGSRTSPCPCRHARFCRKAGSTLLDHWARCGQVGDAYSITVTLAAGSPSTLSGIATFPSFARRVIALLGQRDRRQTGEAAPRQGGEVRVSRRVSFTTGTPCFSGGTLHRPKGRQVTQTVRFSHALARDV